MKNCKLIWNGNNPVIECPDNKTSGEMANVLREGVLVRPKKIDASVEPKPKKVK